MTTYSEPNLAATSRTLGNLDGTSAGLGGTDTVRIQSGTGNFLTTNSSTVSATYVSGNSTVLSINMQNVGVGSDVFARKESDNVTFSFRRLQGVGNITISQQQDTILIASTVQNVDRFIKLLDAPSSYQGANGQVVTVDEANSRLIFTTPAPPVESFIELTDAPSSYENANGQFVRVNGNSLEFSDLPSESFLSLTDTPKSYTGQNGKFAVVNEATQELEFGIPQFIGLSDTPKTYTGYDGKFLAVDAVNNQIIFTDIAIPKQGNQITFSETPPSNPNQGDGWWDIEDGSFYLYYIDTNGGQWVESGSAEPAAVPEVSLAYDYGSFFEGQPSDSEILYCWRSPRNHTLNENFQGCLFACSVNPSVDFIATIWINGSQVGTWTIDTNGNSTMVSSIQGTISVAAYQEIKIIGPAVADGTISDIVISFMGERV